MNDQMRHFFDRLAPGWNHDSEHDIRANIIDISGFSENSVIADIGCGRGAMLPYLLSINPKQIYAIDISGEMLKYAKEAYTDKRIEYLNEDVLSLVLPSLDAALLFNSYPHFLDKKLLAKKLADSIIQGGFVVIAHSAGRERINSIHYERDAMHISALLRPAQEEAKEFLPYFVPVQILDEESIYFIKMVRAQ